MYVLSEIETCKKIKRFVLCSRGKKCYRSVCYFSGLFTVVCLYVICGYSCNNNPLFLWSN